ncbi:zinc-ribbon and DUF3426 domain-containing protein [Paraburkholderia unamae]|uniref:Zn finger-like uncharacterized protein n=1 Tax=Paraburkholderia unamae TaxID=219649 RepID=A0ABX5KDK5_9BURK|nr:zinc-ribbon and DUF3426 domain-containing protein [Paraburkholderia unamae]PVX70608.1 putative Zn finger-like uncharacterized protein [Paraburkholderia unamae]CAG9244801.1 putative transmembrane protein [Paraburkholderia unamae]
MHLATRCPFCETVFRIQPTQLAVRRGLVRCGHCQEAFDASGSLYEVPEGADFSTAVPVAAEIAASLTAPAAADFGSQFAAQPDTPPAAAAPPQEPPPELRPTPNFANRAWDPWAPPANSQIDPRLKYSADQLPGGGRAPAATPGVTRGVESQIIFDDEPAFARPPHEAPGAPAVAVDATANAAPPPVPPAPPVTPAAPQQPQAAEPFPPAERWTRVEPDLGAPAHTEPHFSANEATAARASDPEPTFGQPAREAAPEPAFSALSPNEGAAPFAVTREAPARPRGSRRPGWRILGTLLAILLFALLIVQLAWWQRETVMVYWPDSQSLYQQACEQIGCRVTPPRDIDGLLVEPSDLRQVDNEPHHLELKVPLRNRFNVALAYPAIELTLLDRQNNIVVRRVMWPQDYVTPGTPIEAGLPARTTQTMIVRLDTGDVVASNFRIEIFYP